MTQVNLVALSLTQEQITLLEKVVSRIIPFDGEPGAAETDVAEYMAEALLSRTHCHLLPTFIDGLDFIEEVARDMKSKSFHECLAGEQDEVLKSVQSFPNNEVRSFYKSLIDLSLEGFLCDPQYKGNRGSLGWKYMGYAPEINDRCKVKV